MEIVNRSSEAPIATSKFAVPRRRADVVRRSRLNSHIDAAIGGSFLYTLNSGAHSISGFAIRTDGSLEPVGETAGLPAGANGLVAR